MRVASPGRPRRLSWATAWGLLALLFARGAVSVPLVLHDATMSHDGEAPVAITLPWKVRRTGGFVMKARIDSHFFSHPVLRVAPDTGMMEIFVDGRPVHPPTAPRDPAYPGGGMEVDLASVLPRGSSELELRFTNAYESFGGMRIDASPMRDDPTRLLLIAASGVCAVAALAFLVAPLGFDLATRGLLGAAFLVEVAYFTGTAPGDRGYDVGSHLEYVELLRSTHEVPAPGDCFVCYHPVLPYAAAALVAETAEAAGFEDSARVLQVLALAFAAVVLVWSARTLALFFPPGPVLWTMTALVAFFPAQIHGAPRVGNDGPLYAALAVAFFHLCRWWRGDHARGGVDERRALLFGALALNIKTNAIVIVATQGGLLAWAVLADLRRDLASRSMAWWKRQVSWALFAATVVALALLAALSRTLFDDTRPSDDPVIVANARGLPEEQRVGAGLANFVGFDVVRWFEVPWASTTKDHTGRQQFLPHLLRTALSGESEPAGESALAILRAMTALFALLVCWWALGLLRALRPKNLEPLLPASAATILWFAAMVAMRIATPYACASHWRYMAPAVVPMALLIGSSWQSLLGNPKRRAAVDGVAIAVVAVFSLLSVVYWMLPAVASLTAT